MLVVRDGREKGRGREYKGERGERTEGETETSNPLVHSPMATADLVRAKPGTRHSTWISDLGNGVQALGPSSSAFPGH